MEYIDAVSPLTPRPLERRFYMRGAQTVVLELDGTLHDADPNDPDLIALGERIAGYLEADRLEEEAATADYRAELAIKIRALPLFDPGMDGCEPWQDNWTWEPPDKVHVNRAAVLRLIEGD